MSTKEEIQNFRTRALDGISRHYHCNVFFATLIARFTKNDAYYRYRCYKHLRKYMDLKESKNFIGKLYNYRQYSYFAHKINVLMVCKRIGDNFYFEHGDIVINADCVIGDNVRLIGNNCLGAGKNGAPKLGDNIDIGWGACVIGGVSIASNTTIGANATITKDITESGTYVSVNKKIK